MIESEDITQEWVENLIGEYLYTGRLPKEQEIADSLNDTTRILERKKVIDRIKYAIQNIVEIFEWEQ